MMFELRPTRHGDELALERFFKEFIDDPYFQPHPMDYSAASAVCPYRGNDVYLVVGLSSDIVAYGLLRGWDEGYDVPSLGIAVSKHYRRRGFGRLMMEALHTCARLRSAPSVRLRVHHDNVGAQLLYSSLGYAHQGVSRGEDLYVLDLNTA